MPGNGIGPPVILLNLLLRPKRTKVATDAR
jgi:hypothetical protein